MRVGPAGTTLDFELEAAVIDLEQSVVSASRRPEKALDAPASISIVEAAEIRARPALSVSEHVRDQPGVDFAKTGLVQSNVVARGFNNVFSGVLLTMTDNRIARVPSLRINVQNFIPVTNEDIERIEVVLGPGSALYGPNSASGVMHIITRSPFNSAGTSVSIGGGERSLAGGSMRHAGVLNPYLAYKISAQYYSGTDWAYVDSVEVAERRRAIASLADPADSAGVLIGARHEQVERRGLEARVDVRPGEDLTAVLTYGYNQGDHVEQTGLGAGQALAWTYHFFQGRAVYRDLFVQYYRNESDANDSYLLRTGESIVDRSTLDVFQAQHAWGPARQRFTYGLDAQFTRPRTEGTINGRNEEEDAIDEIGLYLQSETGLAPQLDLLLSLRYDTHSRLDDAEVSPRAGLLYKPRESQSFRLTWNRAFSTPSTSNLYIDILAQKGVFTPLEAFAPMLGYNPNVDIRAQGTYRSGQASGFTFRRGADGRAMYRSSFQPSIDGALGSMGLDPGDAGYPVDGDGYIRLDDPVATNVQWIIGRNAVLAQFVPSMQLLMPGLIAGMLVEQGMEAESAESVAREQTEAVLTALPSLVPEQLPGLTNSLGLLNTFTLGFDPVADATDVPGTKSTITRTLELGYKGILSEGLVVSADLYRSSLERFVGALAVETPNVFLDGESLMAALEPALAAQLADPANAAGGAGSGSDGPALPAGSGRGGRGRQRRRRAGLDLRLRRLGDPLRHGVAGAGLGPHGRAAHLPQLRQGRPLRARLGRRLVPGRELEPHGRLLLHERSEVRQHLPGRPQRADAQVQRGRLLAPAAVRPRARRPPALHRLLPHELGGIRGRGGRPHQSRPEVPVRPALRQRAAPAGERRQRPRSALPGLRGRPGARPAGPRPARVRVLTPGRPPARPIGHPADSAPGREAHPMTPSLRRRANSSRETPASSARISSVCCPRSGAGRGSSTQSGLREPQR